MSYECIIFIFVGCCMFTSRMLKAPRLIAKHSDFNCVFETDAATVEGYDAGVYVGLVMLDHNRERHLCGLLHYRQNETLEVHEKFFTALAKV